MPCARAAAERAAQPAPSDRLRIRHRTAAVPGPDHPRRDPSAGDRPVVAKPARVGSGTRSSPATILPATKPWSAPGCATPSMTTTAGRSPTSARTSSPLCAAACPGTGPSDTTSPRCSSRPSSRPRAAPVPSTVHQAGYGSGPPRGAGATTGKLYDKPRKDVWLRPLRRDWQRTLNR